MKNQKEKDFYYDKEWEDASSADEKPCVYRHVTRNGVLMYKTYKPSVAALISKRTGIRMELVG